MTESGALEPPAFDYGVIVRALEESVGRNLGDGLLLSGGLDTAILAYLAVKWVKPGCVTVALRGAPAPDVEYAELVASRLELDHDVYYFDREELDDSIRAVVRIMKTFDPMGIRNDAAVYIALKMGREKGLSTIMTGDACDELFAGYSFFFGLTREQLDAALKRMQVDMRFSSEYLARELGLEVRIPFLDPQFKAMAADLDVGLKVRSERGQVWGKWVLRKAFENIMPPEIVWRTKAPVEVGTGTTILPALCDLGISDPEFSQKKAKYLREDGVTIRDKEHLCYYEIYRDEIGVPYARDSEARSCPGCGSNVEQETSFCRTCGAYPI
jgi:asparagine synthase (glutamine-hydrolysing)